MSTALPSAKSALQNGSTIYKARLWSDLAPGHIAQASRCDEPGEVWTAWSIYLAQRPAPPAWETLFPAKASALAWGLSTSDVPPDALDLHKKLRKRLKRAGAGQIDPLAQDWLTATQGAAPTASLALESLVWAYALPTLAGSMSPSIWWELVERLIATAHDAAALDQGVGPLVQPWLAAELPLALAAMLPEIFACHALASTGAAALHGGMERLVSDKGLPIASQLHLLPGLLACWTRCLLAGGHNGELMASVRAPMVAALRALLALLRRDGTLLLVSGPADRRMDALLAAASSAVDDRLTRDLARRLLEQKPPRKKKKAGGELPLPAVQCDTARLAVLRTDWTPAATSLAVRHDRAEIELELHRDGVTLAAGAWSLDIMVAGRRADVQRPWENVCWVSDEDVDYLELEARFSGGWRVQRQMLLARQEGFLYLADALVGSSAAPLDYRSHLPLGAAVNCQPAAETREMQLHLGKPIGVALPLALPEWRNDPRGGALSAKDGGLELRQSRTAQALYAPMWIDLDRKRSRKPLTWRQLTVAQDRRIVAGDVAVGYRVQVGHKQWLIYRSLAERANRTLLGSNLVSEFMLARFTPEGEAEPLLEIE